MVSPEAAGFFQQTTSCATRLGRLEGTERKLGVCLYHGTGAKCKDHAIRFGRPAHCNNCLVNMSPFQNRLQRVDVSEEEVDALLEKHWCEQVGRVVRE